MEFVHFPSIECFHNVVKFSEKCPEAIHGVVRYRGKIKLHGSNAGIHIQNGEVTAQSRTRVVTRYDDNAGFAKWVEASKSYWEAIAGFNPDMKDFTVFGEWCGPGIGSGTAIQNISNKIFVIFAIAVGGDEDPDSVIISEPSILSNMFGKLPSDVKILPWEGEEIAVDFSNREQLKSTASMLNKKIVDIEPCDPWVKETFGVEGVCEGVVYYPDAGANILRSRFKDFVFKAKGEKHKHVKTKDSVQLDPEVVKSIDEFVIMFVTEPRMEQGLSAVGGKDMKNISNFLKWVFTDILKESVDELEASGLQWDQVVKSVQSSARTWFLAKNKAL